MRPNVIQMAARDYVIGDANICRMSCSGRRKVARLKQGYLSSRRADFPVGSAAQGVSCGFLRASDSVKPIALLEHAI